MSPARKTRAQAPGLVTAKPGPVLPLTALALHAQVRETIRARILDGSYPAHSQVPSESQMMEAFGVSRITIRQALGDLQKEGLIFKIAG